LQQVKPYICVLVFLLFFSRPVFVHAQQDKQLIRFDFYGDSIALPYSPVAFTDFDGPLTTERIELFYKKVSTGGFTPLVTSLVTVKKDLKLDDWVFYQLIRRTVQQISPKEANYHRYTLYKWYLLSASGYESLLTAYNDTLMFYVKSHENIYNIPSRMKNGNQFICLNYHDYGSNIDFRKTRFREIEVTVPGASRSFSYKVSNLPNFRPDNYLEKDLRFNYHDHTYFFKVKLNPEIQSLFINYPAVDYASHFNIPLSQQAYLSLIPLLKKEVAKKTERQGIDFLMRFTRGAFVFEPDAAAFGAEKRLSPEQTLLYDQSDCEDRAALLYYLVKEIYNLPMIVLVYPEHVTLAVALQKPVGTAIVFDGKKYTVCEPTPQKKELRLGEMLPQLKKIPYEVGYVYDPGKN
jgi:hypothetical protein